jgi:glutamate dehydrogenase (NAD(P)+)
MKSAEKKTPGREVFLAELMALRARFDSMEPELAETVADPDMGVEGYVVVWNTKISEGGPLQYSGKGGTRATPTLSLDEVKMLSRNMAIKNAAAGLKMGGAKSGIKADPDAPDFEKKYRRFVSLCKPLLHENGGIFGGFGFDIGSKPVHARWACDELKSTRSFTGKPLDMGGTDYDREGIAGLGVAVAAKTMMELKGENPAKATFAVQGMGAMGAAVYRYFSETGARLAALGDPKYGGTWAFDKPLSREFHEALVRQDVEKAKTLLAKEGRKISGDTQDVLYQEVDVLFPSAVQDVITDANVDRIKARFMSEGANKPTKESAQLRLHERGIWVVPDFIANPGGVIAAYVELTSQSDNKAEEAKDFTRRKITENVKEMVALMDEYDVAPQQAGMYMALSKILGPR